MSLSPIALFVYNRLDHTVKTVESLQKNILAMDSEIIVYSDAAKDTNVINQVNKVRDYISTINGFKKITIIMRPTNFGLANSIIDGVTTIVNKYGKIIVLEDDLVTSPYFLSFMNEALEFYENKRDVYSITGFNYPLKITSDYMFGTYLYPRCSSKSWATWKNKWRKIEFNENEIINKWNLSKIEFKIDPYGKDLYRMFKSQLNQDINSWAIRFAVNQIMLEKYTAYPVKSYVLDIGDDSGTHANNSLAHKVVVSNELIVNFTKQYDDDFRRMYSKYLRSYFFKSRLHIVKNKVKNIFFDV
jgi:hypothetical protein